MTYQVIFYSPATPKRLVTETFTKQDTAKKWAALVRRNGYRVKPIKEVTV